MACLDSARLKIKRAKKHILDLDTLIGNFCDSNPYAILAKPHRIPEINHTTLYMGEIDSIPDIINLTIGDAVHNLRTALDHMAYQLVFANGRSSADHVHFPICDPCEKFTSAAHGGKIKGMSVGAKKLVRAVQPHVTGDNTLWYLHRLDIVDKHRLVITSNLDLAGWGVDIMKGNELWFEQGYTFSLEKGQEITNIPTTTYNRQKHEDFKLILTITFGKSEVLEGESVLPTLHNMHTFVENLVGDFERLLP